jgi:hypothetical protein
MNSNRPVSITHLVVGIVFLGIAAVWAIGAGTDADVPELAVSGPVVLIVAGAIGLVATLLNARRTRTLENDSTEELR